MQINILWGDLAADISAKKEALLQVTHTNHNMFCPGTALMFDGNLLVNGGSGSERTSIYNPFSKNWAPGGNAVIKRGYSANTVLSNGNVFTIGGSWCAVLPL